MERHSSSYVQLIKPGITLSNTISAVAGFLLAASIFPFSWSAGIGVILGTALIIASACTVNNVIDRDIDKRMKRTAKRQVVIGAISVRRAIGLAMLLGALGFGLLVNWTNLLTAGLGLLAYVWYVVVYGYAKRTTIASTLIGGVAGALPPVAGYTALAGHIDGAAIILFLILFFWQMPHFYAISMFRLKDYASAKLPIWSVVKGPQSTKRQIFIFAVLYGLTVPLLTLLGYTGIVYGVISTALAAYWIFKGVQGYRSQTDEKWSRKMFGISLLVLLSECLLIAIGGYLP